MSLRTASFRWHRAFDGLQCCGGCPDDVRHEVTRAPVLVGRSLAATVEIAALVHTVGEACDRLRRYVLPFCRVLFGDVIESIEELVVRGQLFVLMTCVHRIREVISRPENSLRCGDALLDILEDFPGGLDEVVGYVELEVNRIASLWTQLRGGNPSNLGAATSSILVDYWPLHRRAVLAAQRELFGLMDNTRFGRFLVAGIIHPELHRLRADCAQIATALQIWLCGELSFAIPGLQATGASSLAKSGTTPQPINA